MSTIKRSECNIMHMRKKLVATAKAVRYTTSSCHVDDEYDLSCLLTLLSRLYSAFEGA